MTPEMAAEAMRAYAEETNRLNRERQAMAETTRIELAETALAIAEIVRVIEQGGWHRALSDRLPSLKPDRTASPPVCRTPGSAGWLRRLCGTQVLLDLGTWRSSASEQTS